MKKPTIHIYKEETSLWLRSKNTSKVDKTIIGTQILQILADAKTKNEADSGIIQDLKAFF